MLARQFEEWAPWREVKAAPPAANFLYSTLIDRLSALGPDVARQWVPVVGVDAALVWWQLGASPADAERALCEISAEFPDLASREPGAAATIGAPVNAPSSPRNPRYSW